MVLCTMFEKLKIVVFNYHNSKLEKCQEFSLKIGALGTFDFLLIAALNEFKTN